MLTQETQTREHTIDLSPSAQKVTQTTRISDPTAVVSGSPQQAYRTKKVIFHTYQVIWYILGIVEVILAFRLMLKLLGANTTSGFTKLVYGISSPFAMPFSGIVGASGNDKMIMEWSTVIAMIVYAILAYGIAAFFQLVKPTNQQEVERTVDNQE